MSGGKDSVALWLWAKRTGLAPRAVFCDTGWAAPQTYDYLRYLETAIGPIVRIAHLCHDSRAKDGNIRAALIDRFGPGKDRAIGRKATPGPLFGVSSDVWSALAIAVTFTDTHAK